ncbi:hypothetical protein D8X55_00970 [Malacoplasma penetrans]|uniref:Transmembrane protein n=1 Tax=Malacoplasma penetrans (strain HF-2) TaxID=272633 RepID=Q8EVU3_MALP2|nr:hypothetical protein [Malacoplasma penetrans]RXY97256.1 hypothetical protein D8X55_00970 [Malacoplasma penetrans]BAC44256.1 hypothetical protein [Malacoplasma penetrans HF-2]
MFVNENRVKSTFKKEEIKNYKDFDFSDRSEHLNNQRIFEVQKIRKSLSLNVDFEKLNEIQQSKNFEQTLNEFCIPFIKDKKNKRIYYLSIFISILFRIVLHGFWIVLCTVLLFFLNKILPVKSYEWIYYILFFLAFYFLNSTICYQIYFYKGHMKETKYIRRGLIGFSTTNIFIYGQTRRLVKKSFQLMSNNKEEKDNKEKFVFLINAYFNFYLLRTFFSNTKFKFDKQINSSTQKTKTVSIKFRLFYFYGLYLNLYPYFCLYVSMIFYFCIGQIIYQIFLINILF